MKNKGKELVLIPTRAEKEDCLPQYGSNWASGADVKAFLKDEIVMLPGSSALISTGIRLEIPPGFEVQVRPRSGLALRYGITVLNTPGTVDADYRGEICVILINHGTRPFVVEPGMRIAQLVVAPVLRAKFVKENVISETKRGEGGFGHTGFY